MAQKVQNRYELREPLGRGGMGVVYRAYDTVMKRDVALKTLLDVDNQIALDLFYREWGVQAAIVHPNIIEIYDIGEFEEEKGVKKPFFVMPLLRGVTLDTIIADGRASLTVGRVVDIFEQACRGLHAAHERGLIHRDLKPSNVFVMEDDSVKIIDFGIAHIAQTGAKTTLKGTLSYMAPEQLQLKGPSVRTDIFSLGVSCFEALTGQRPFLGESDHEITQAILHQQPPAVSDLNSSVNQALSQVVHKSLAKDPISRFAAARDFGESLRKAFAGEPLDFLDVEKIKPRLGRAQAAFDHGHYEVASEIVADLEAEGHLSPEIQSLRKQLDRALRQGRIKKLLESARRFVDAEEHALAIRKIQDALDLDPEDADVLALQHAVEKKRREKQVGEWIELARRHLDNSAFAKAREAVDHVLEEKPTDTDALRLTAEIERREKEIQEVRQKKGILYEAALEAWDRGDVTSALSKLENLVSIEDDSPETDASRGTTYQKLYQEVRSEHDRIRGLFEQARTLLADEKFADALKICEQHLAKYPNHALFQSLKFDIEQAKRQKVSSYIAEIDRRVDEEPDPDRRLAILDEALAACPDEDHFQKAARLVKDKRDLIRSIVTKAKFFEGRRQIQEALDQWEILRSIHKDYPGLEDQLAELTRKRDEQARENSRSRYIDQINRSLDSGRFDEARKAVQAALEEFSDDPELTSLGEETKKRAERTRAATKLFDEGRESIESGRVEEGLAALRKAHEANRRDPMVRRVLVNTLLQRARAAVEDDTRAAAEIVEEAESVDPSNKQVAALKSRIEGLEREAYVAKTMGELRKLRDKGESQQAGALVEEALKRYPGEGRFREFRNVLASAEEEPTIAVPGIGAVSEPPSAAPLATPAPPPQPPAPPTTPSAPSRPAPPPEKPPAAAAPGFLAAVVDQLRQLGSGAASGAKSLDQKTLAFIGAGALGVALVAAALIVGLSSRRQEEPPAPVEGAFEVVVRSSPPGAEILADGAPCGESPCRASLSPGAHRFEARMAGFRPAFLLLNIDRDSPPGDDPYVLTLEPLLAKLEISSDLERGVVRLDDVEVGRLEDGVFLLENLSPGDHILVVDDRGARITAEIEVDPGEIPQVRSLKAVNLKVAMVASLGSEATLYSGQSGEKIWLDGDEAGQTVEEGLDLASLSPGTHELAVGDAANSVYFESADHPLLAVLLKSDRNVGGLRILVGEDDATVYLNGKPYRRKTRRGRVLLYLRPGRVRVRAAKEGFRDSEEKVAEVRKGVERRIELTLEPLPQIAAVQIRGGAPGTEVLLDGRKIGSISRTGTFSASNIAPGRHKISLRHPSYEPREIEREWRGGQTVEVSGALQSIVGTLSISVSPPDVDGLSMTVRREGRSRARPITGTTLQLPEGTYTVTARAPGYKDYAATLRIERRQTKTASINLSRIVNRPAAVKPSFQLNQWIVTGDWTRQGQLAVRQGGGFVLAPVPSTSGEFRFTAYTIAKRMEWVVNYIDQKNHTLFQLDKKNFTRIQVVNGKKKTGRKTAHRIDARNFVSVQVEIDAHKIVCRLLDGDEWRTIDEWENPAAELDRGKFGFRIPGRDRLALSFFAFFPRK